MIVWATPNVLCYEYLTRPSINDAVVSRLHDFYGRLESLLEEFNNGVFQRTPYYTIPPLSSTKTI